MSLDLFQATFLALLQGLTEFLPISSSGHLLLPSQLWGWPDQGLNFDVAVHVGSLLAVVVYFRKDLLRLTTAFFTNLNHPLGSQDSRLAWFLVLATIPGGLAGLLLNDLVAGSARSMLVVGCTSIFFALLLFVADRTGTRQRNLQSLGLRDAIIIGLAQAVALIPGTSRSGITMTAGLFLHLERDAAARFSFLLSIPIILASGALTVFDLAEAGAGSVDLITLVYGALVSGVTAYTCIHYFLVLIGRIGFLPFVIYRVLLGLMLISIALSQ